LELSIGVHKCFEAGLELCVRDHYLLKTQLSIALQLSMREHNSLFTMSRRKESFLDHLRRADGVRRVGRRAAAETTGDLDGRCGRTPCHGGEGADGEYLGDQEGK